VRLETAARLAALAELQEIGARAGVEGRTDDVVRGAVELATAASSAADRARVWELVRGANNDYLVRPLVDALVSDSSADVRLAAVRTLAADYGDRAAVRAALEQTAYADDSAAVRREASWAVRDADGRNADVRDALLDTSRGDEERVAPLLFALERELTVPTNSYAVDIDDTAAAALVEILRRTASDGGSALPLALVARVSHPALTDFHVGVLGSDPNEQRRMAAAVALRQRLGEPQARAALERARGDDASPSVRDAAARALAE
jgi:hypothetical protein